MWSPLSWFELEGQYSLDREDMFQRNLTPRGYQSDQSGFSTGSLTRSQDLANDVNEAALLAIREETGSISMEHLEEAVQRLPHLGGVTPVVVGPRVHLLLRADEGAVLDAGDVARVGAGEEGVGAQLRVEPDERAGVDQGLAEPVVLVL